MFLFGKVLNIDLNTGEVWREKLNESIIADFLGGRGVAAKFLWEKVAKGIDPLSKDNILIFATGPLTGTLAPASGRLTVSAKGPATNLYLKTSAGGHLGAALRMSGNDCVVIHGASNTPVYVWINGNKVEIRDATHLWGKKVRETNEILKKETEEKAEIASIGPAGENLVKFASIMVSYYNAAARGGIGAVMGSKKLKALVVSGWGGRIYVANPRKFGEIAALSREAIYADTTAPGLHKYGTAGGVNPWNKVHMLPSYNFKTAHIEDARKISGHFWATEGYLKRKIGCNACPITCHRFTAVNTGKYAGTYSGGPEYETTSSLASGCGIDDPEVLFKANELCNDLGLDSISAGGVIQWAMETYEKGLLTKKNADGLDLKWGNEEAVIELLKRIAYREGIGNILAEGTKRASEKIGGDSWKWAVQARGLEQSRVELRGAFAYALAFAVNPRGPDHLHSECLAEFGATPEAVKTIEKITGDKKYARPDILDKRAEIVKWHEDIFAVSDALGLCAFTTTATYGIDEKKAAKLFQYATGIDMSAEEIMKAGERILTLERCFNVREGLTRNDDKLPWRMMNEYQYDLKNVSDPIVSQEILDKMLDEYYKLHGWDKKTGKPTKNTLNKFNLSFMIQTLGI